MKKPAINHTGFGNQDVFGGLYKSSPQRVVDLAILLKHKTAEWEAHVPNPRWTRVDSLCSSDLQK